MRIRWNGVKMPNSKNLKKLNNKENEITISTTDKEINSWCNFSSRQPGSKSMADIEIDAWCADLHETATKDKKNKKQEK